jgi:drug/metabolite transporter (DMT)-like permease
MSVSEPPGTAAPEGSPIIGIALICLGAICMVGLDASARMLLETYSLPQLVLLRCLFSISLIIAFTAARSGFAVLRTHRPGWHVFRSFLMAGSMFAFFHALRHIPLADVIIIAFAAPLIVTSLSRPFLGEPVGPWRWTAVIVGFIGVLVVLRPGSGLMHPAAFIALGGSVTYASLSLTARKLRNTESTAALSIYLFGVPGVMGAVGSYGHWTTPDTTGWILFAVCGFFGGLAFIFMNAAYRQAQAAVIVPFEYTGLIWAAAAGYVFWGEVPGANTWLGAAIIIASGLFILFRETAVRRRPQPQLDFPMQEVACVTPEED